MTIARVDTLNVADIARRSACATGTVRTHAASAAMPVRKVVRVTATSTSLPGGSADPAATADTVVDGDCVGEREGDIERVDTPEGVPDDVPEGACESLLLSDPESDELGVFAGVALRVQLVVALKVALGDALPEAVSLGLGGAVTEGELLVDDEAVALRVPDCDPEAVPEAERAAEGVHEPEVVAVALPVLAALAVPVSVGAWLGLSEGA